MYFLLAFLLEIITCTDPDHQRQFFLNHFHWLKSQSNSLFCDSKLLACQQCSVRATKVTFELCKKLCLHVCVIQMLAQIASVSGWFHCNARLIGALGKFLVIKIWSVLLGHELYYVE